jgi:hypothetical protein
VFGLGTADNIESLSIQGPSGAETDVAAAKLGVNQRLEIKE